MKDLLVFLVFLSFQFSHQEKSPGFSLSYMMQIFQVTYCEQLPFTSWDTEQSRKQRGCHFKDLSLLALF